MLPEISLNVLDIAVNSLRAEASLITIHVMIDRKADKLTVIVTDDGYGMTNEQLNQVEDPFFTTKSTRKTGLGIPFFKMAALAAGGEFEIVSSPGVGTKVKAVFGLSHIDRMPLGDMNGTVYTLVTLNPQADFVYTYQFDDKCFTLDTRELKETLEGVPTDRPEVANFLKAFLKENSAEVDGGVTV